MRGGGGASYTCFNYSTYELLASVTISAPQDYIEFMIVQGVKEAQAVAVQPLERMSG